MSKLLSIGSDADPGDDTRPETGEDAPIPEPVDRDLPAGAQVGRYIVLERLGQGGMGVVYKAYDPELDRRIALKLLRIRQNTESRANRARDRLLREAQALAQLSHPNVVSAYDAGTVAGDVFVVMELVEGDTLNRWIEKNHPPRRRIVEAMIAAGRGIAAAHQAGLIHRDIKPGNIIVGDDGRVRVLDFGLARWSELGDGLSAGRGPIEDDDSLGRSAREAKILEETLSGDSRLKTELTLAGSILGTPGYMAPEQYVGGETDAYSDQYGFCVTLFEVLYGQRPFGRKRYRNLKELAEAQKQLAPPTDAKVPTRLRRIVMRGLSATKEDRFSSMDQLLAELAKDPWEFWRRSLVAMLLLLLLGTGVAFAIFYQAQKRDLCTGASHQIESVWGEQARASVRTAFVATGRSYAADTFDRVEKVLSKYTKNWAAMRTEACQATHLRGEQSEVLLDLRMQCLDRGRAQVRALVELFAAKDAEVLDKAVSAATGLPDLQNCADFKALTAVRPPPSDPALRAKVKVLQERLEKSHALESAGKYQQALEVTQAVWWEAESIDYAALRASVLDSFGSLQSAVGESKKAEKSYREALMAAAAANDDPLAADISCAMIFVVGYELARPDEAAGIGILALAQVQRAGNDPYLQGRCHNNMGVVAAAQGKYADAQHHMEAAILAWKGMEELDTLITQPMNNLGNVLARQGKLEQARKYFVESLQIKETTLGLEHPSLAPTLNNLGVLLLMMKRYDESRIQLERSLNIRESVLGYEHPDVASSLTNLGTLLQKQSNFEGARVKFERAVKIWQKKLGPDHPLVANPLTGLGDCLVALHQADRALPQLEQALRLREANPGDPTDLAHTRFSLAKALWLSNKGRIRAFRLARKANQAFRDAGESMKEDREEVEAWLSKHKTKGAD